MQEEYGADKKGFIISYEAWYAETSVKPFENEHIIIGIYCEEGGTKGEFRLEWNNFGIQLIAYNDAWEALSKMPELVELLARVDREEKEPTVKEFAELLAGLGYKDMTERKRTEE